MNDPQQRSEDERPTFALRIPTPTPVTSRSEEPDPKADSGLPFYGTMQGGGPPRNKSAGETFTESTVFTAFGSRFPDATGVPAGFTSDPVVVGGMRTLITAGDASAGDLVRPFYQGLLEPGLVRPLLLRDLVTIIPTTESGSVEYNREASRSTAAAPVAESTALTGTSGTKPEGALTFALETAPVRTIALWLPVTTRVLSDAPELRMYIDTYLTEDVLREVEDQMVAGSGSGEDFEGILNVSAIGTAGPPAAGQSVLHTLREGIRKVRLDGRSSPTAIVMHPTDAEMVDLLEVNDEVNHFVGPGPYGAPQRSLWGVPVIETDAVPQGTVLMGDFSKAVLFDRQAVTISVGTINDQFTRNQVTVLAEVRAAFAVLRPTAFVAVDIA